MKVLLLYHFQGNFALAGMEPVGLIQLGQMLKDRGHQVRYATLEKASVKKTLADFTPGLIGYSICSVHHQRALRLNLELKQGLDFFAAFGGPHPTFFPELIEAEGVDAICVGEGDQSFPDFVDRLEAGEDITGVPNLWVKLGPGEVAKNDPAPLIEDLDSLPYPDREGLYQDRWMREYRIKTFINSRGCPFACTYCYNGLYRDLYRGKGRVWRSRSPSHLVGEIEWVKRTWPLRQLSFVDDMFIPSRKWLAEFAPEYRRRIGLPFNCLLRLDRVDDESAGLLAEAGCFSAWAAIESGVERIRRETLGRRMTDEQILAGAAALKRHGIKLYIQNMMGVPGETLEDALATLDLNVRAQADLAITSLFTPFPHLALTERAIAQGYYSGDVNELPDNMTARSVLKLPEIKQIERLQKLLPALIDSPWLRRRARLLVRLPLHPVYHWLRNAWMAVKYYRELAFRPSLREHLEMAIRGLTYILKDR